MTFDEMTREEKIEHIWEYYKLHIIGGILALIFIFSLLNTFIFNPAPDVVLDLTVRAPIDHYDMDGQIVIVDALEEILIEEGANEMVLVELLQIGEGLDPNSAMAAEAKFMGKAEVGEMDLLIVEDYFFSILAVEGFFRDIDDFEDTYGIRLPDEGRMKAIDRYTDIEGTFAIDIKHFPGLSTLIRNNDPVNYYIGITTASAHAENAVEVLEYLMEE